VHVVVARRRRPAARELSMRLQRARAVRNLRDEPGDFVNDKSYELGALICLFSRRAA